jgi:hypothetical protein
LPPAELERERIPAGMPRTEARRYHNAVRWFAHTLPLEIAVFITNEPWHPGGRIATATGAYLPCERLTGAQCYVRINPAAANDP